MCLVKFTVYTTAMVVVACRYPCLPFANRQSTLIFLLLVVCRLMVWPSVIRMSLCLYGGHTEDFFSQKSYRGSRFQIFSVPSFRQQHNSTRDNNTTAQGSIRHNNTTAQGSICRRSISQVQFHKIRQGDKIARQDNETRSQ